jgi:hypothetical protein
MNMNLLLSMAIYLIVGCGEWYLALRRTLAVARGEKVLLVSIVFIENLLGLWVLSNFIRTNNWGLALCYSAGASAGALIVAMNGKTKSAKATTSLASRRQRSDTDIAVAQTQRLLFDMSESPEEPELRTLESTHAMIRTVRRKAVERLVSTRKTITGAGRDWWNRCLSSRRRDGQPVELSS